MTNDNDDDSCQCVKHCIYKFIVIASTLVATVLIIYGIATWNDQYITTCTITHYYQSYSECEFQYYTPGNKNCSKPTYEILFAGGDTLCNVFKTYGTPDSPNTDHRSGNSGKGPTVPCLVNTCIDWSKCPDSLYGDNKPYYNYLATITKAQMCSLIGCLIVLLNTIILIVYVFYKVHVLEKFKDKFKTVNPRQPLIQ